MLEQQALAAARREERAAAGLPPLPEPSRQVSKYSAASIAAVVADALERFCPPLPVEGQRELAQSPVVERGGVRSDSEPQPAAAVEALPSDATQGRTAPRAWHPAGGESGKQFQRMDPAAARAARLLLRKPASVRARAAVPPPRELPRAGDVNPCEAPEPARVDSCIAAAERPAEKPQRMPMWQVSRRERRIAAEVFAAEDARTVRYPEWMTPDDELRPIAELDALDAHRKKLLAETRRKDGSRLSRLESVFTPAEKHCVRCIRDDAMFAATEWGKLWRADRLLAGLTLEAALGMRADGSCVRDWHSQRARNMLAIVWMFYKCGSTRAAELGEVRVRGVSLNFLCAMLATDGKEELHRNTLGGTHRAYTSRNEEMGYLTALEHARVLGRMQYGDRRNDPRVQEYHLRVTTTDAKHTELLERDEQRLRAWVAARWEKLAQLDALHVLSTAAHKRWLRLTQADKLAEIRACIDGGVDACATDPPS